MKILALMPMYKIMDAPCVQALIGFQGGIFSVGDKIDFAFSNGFNSAKARNALTKYASEVADEYDCVLWLDSDHIYKNEIFYELWKNMNKHELSMLSASYKVRGGDVTAHGRHVDGKFKQYEEDELGDDIVDCDVLGFGFLLMKPEMLKKLRDKYGDDLFKLDNKNNATEDVQFCRIAKDEGYRVCFDPSLKIGHLQVAMRI